MRFEVGWFMHGLTAQAERTCGTGAQSIERMAGLHRRNTGSEKPQAGP